VYFYNGSELVSALRYRVNIPHFISDAIQVQAIVIPLETGMYHGFRQAGA
jgi:hypothetical protein